MCIMYAIIISRVLAAGCTIVSKLQALFGIIIQDIESEKEPRRVVSTEVASGDGTWVWSWPYSC